jgi:NTE family protein
MEHNKTHLVLGGGGIRGISHIGALYALEKLDVLQHITHFAGTSVGSLIIGLYSIGYSPKELYEFIKVFNFNEVKNIDINNISNFGLDTGSKMAYVIKRLIKNKNLSENITLQEIFDLTKKHLIFTTVCINTLQACYVSHETHPKLELFQAIMMSSAIPIIFCPVLYENNMYVDGGCLDNFPISIFQDNIKETIGITILDSTDRVDINDFETYLFRVVKCIGHGLHGSYKLHKNYVDATIEINANFVDSIDFDIDTNTKDELFLIGYDVVLNNLEKLV